MLRTGGEKQCFTKIKISMLNLKRLIMMALIGAVIVSCQDDGVDDLNQLGDVEVEAIDPAELPSSSITFIENNFSGEVVVSAFRVTSDEVDYEALLTNSVNLVFNEDGTLVGYGEEGSVVGCGGKPHGRKGPGGRRGPRGGNPDSTAVDRPEPTEITIDELPAVALEYLDTNYPDSVIHVILLIEKEDATEYHTLVDGVGAVIFDADGTFVEVKEPRRRGCHDFTEMDIADLSAVITDYVTTSYPDNEILGARTGTRNEVVEIHVLVDSVGVLIFDEDGNFIELKTCGMNE